MLGNVTVRKLIILGSDVTVKKFAQGTINVLAKFL